VDAGEPLPAATTANNAGFCTAGFFPAQVWSVGGMDSSGFGITGINRFLGRPDEACYSIYSDVPWLSEAPPTGTLPADSSSAVTITFDTTGLPPGVYHATLVLATNDPGKAQTYVPVTLTVTPVVHLPVFLK
jgi:hypothetical protein